MHPTPKDPASGMSAPAAGRAAQPALGRLSGRLLVQLAAGLAASLLAAVCSIAARWQVLSLAQDDTDVWSSVLVCCCVLAALGSAVQWWCWRRAHQEWSGRRDVALLGMVTPSALSAVWAVPECLVGLWAGHRVWTATGTPEVAHWWALAATVLLVLGVGFGALHRLDLSGPPGVLPHRLHVVGGRRG